MCDMGKHLLGAIVTMSDIIKEYWHQFLGAIVFLVWMVRLEASTKSNSRDIEDMKADWSDVDAKFERFENRINAKFERFEGRMDAQLAELRTDIKTLLRQGVRT